MTAHSQKHSLSVATTRWAIIALLLAAFALRTIGITTAPPGLSGDESMNGADAGAVWNGNPLPIFFPNNFGREAFFLYLMALCVKLWNVSAFTIRLPTILCGMAGLTFTYVWVKRLWNARMALLSVGLLSVSFWPIFTGRVGLRAIAMLPWETLSLYALWRALHERRWRWWIVTGAALGILTYTYIPGRFFAAVPLLWLGVCVVLSARRPWEGADRRKVWAGLLLAAGVALLIFAPFGRFIMQHPEQVNQRVAELDDILQQLRAGNFRPAWQSIRATLGMFTVRGEGDWYYNVSGRPLFDWATGAFFYAGVLLALFRLREPRCQLLLIWTGVMLAPSIFAIGAPSFLRAVGAQIPIYIFPALAFDALWQWLDDYAVRVYTGRVYTHVRFLQRRFGWCACAALALIALRDGQAYFAQWAQTPRTREIYNAGLAQVGAALNARMPLPPNAQVFVGCDYAADLCRNMVRFQTHYAGPIQWFIGRNALIVPRPQPASGDLYYFFGDALPPDDILVPWMQSGDALSVIRSANGALESANMRVPAGRQAQLPWTPQQSLSGQFENALTLLGYDMPAQVARGADLTATVYWQVPDVFEVDASAPLWLNLTLRDADGNVWEKHGALLPYAQWDWTPGTVAAQVLAFPLPAYVPPVTLYPAISLERNGQELPCHLPTGETATAVTLAPLQATGAPTQAPPEEHTRLGLAGEIALGKTLMIGRAMPGERLSATLYWYALEAPHTEYVVRFQWREGNCEGPVVHTAYEPLLAESYPTTHWQAGESLRSTHAPLIPRDLPNGAYQIAIDLVPVTQLDAAPTAAACQPLEIFGRARLFTAPDIANPRAQALSDGVHLLGYDLTPTGIVHPGDTLEVTLYWQAQTMPGDSYTVFVHFYRPDGQVAGQHDGVPCGGACPTFSWVAGEVLVDKHTFTLDPTAGPGDYRLGVGMYSPASLERLNIPGAENNVILLTDISVQP